MRNGRPAKRAVTKPTKRVTYTLTLDQIQAVEEAAAQENIQSGLYIPPAKIVGELIDAHLGSSPPGKKRMRRSA
jgi:hypothetical protein